MLVLEIVPPEQEGLTGGLRERVGKAVAEIRLRGMPAAFTEIAISFAGYAGVRFRGWFDPHPSFSHELVQPRAGDGISV